MLRVGFDTPFDEYEWLLNQRSFKDKNENQNLDCFSGTLYSLGLNVFGDSLRSGNYPAIFSSGDAVLCGWNHSVNLAQD